ncbi:tRNA lysidine(34) synthetase TilS [Chloroflexota bacterium]
MRNKQPLLRQVRRFIQKHRLFEKGEHVVVGVSGGPDSVCLLHILAGLRERLGIKLHVAHLNHLLRGAESDADADYVSRLARKLGIEATVERRDVRVYLREHRLTLEEGARDLRYAFFADVARNLGVEKVVVGHTADDQVETVLMHLLRGSGLTGLGGMQPLTARPADNITVVRPLLEVRRGETEDYCAAQGLSTCTDSSNLLPDRLRNRVRYQLIPSLRVYNPDIEAALLRFSRATAADLDYVNQETSRLWGAVAKHKQGEVTISRARFSTLHPAVKRHLVRSAFERLLGDLQDIEYIHIENLVEALSKPAGKELSLPRGLFFYADYSYGLLTTTEKPAVFSSPVIEGEHRLKIPGGSELPGWRVESRILDRLPKENEQGEFKAYLDLDVAGLDLIVRSRRRGDSFQPLGMEYTKKLQDFMVDAKITRLLRDRVPIVCSPEHMLWVVGWRIDHRARISKYTGRILYLEFNRV